MSDSGKNSVDSTHQTEPPVTQGPDIPETDDDWFALIQPHIEVSPEDADEDTITRIARRHAEQVVERTGMAVDLDRISWRATYELRGKHGYCRGNFIKLSRHSLETNGWQRTMKTVRHELVHVWQHQSFLFPARGRSESAHGPSFEKWMPVLNVRKRGGHIRPLWSIQCPECQTTIDTKRTTQAKRITRLLQTLDTTACDQCGHVWSDPTVTRGDEEVALESLPAVLSEEQNQILLYEETPPASQSDTYEPNRETRKLTDLTGIGEVTARRLGDDITHVDELLDIEEGTLTDPVQTAVSTQYHATLRDEVSDWYRTALKCHPPEELDSIEEQFLTADTDWTYKTENVEVTDDPKLMCHLLRFEADRNDRFRITTDEFGDLTIQIDTESKEMSDARVVEIEPESTPLGSRALMIVPSPYQGDRPYIEDRRDPPDSHPITVGSSGYTYVLHQREITEIERQESSS